MSASLVSKSSQLDRTGREIRQTIQNNTDMQNIKAMAYAAQVGDMLPIYPGDDSDYYRVLEKTPEYLIVIRGRRGRRKYRYYLDSLRLEQILVGIT